MTEKSKGLRRPWVDPDDAPELTDEFFEHGEWKIGDRKVSREEGRVAARRAMGRPKLTRPKQALTVRYDADIVEAFRSTGPGWQTRMNDALRDWLRTHPQR